MITTTNSSCLIRAKALFRVSYYAILLVFIMMANFIYAQKSPSDGMQSVERNFSSFSKQNQQNLSSWKALNDSKYYNHPDFGILAENAPCSECVEDLSKREKDLRYYIDINDNSRFYVQKAHGLLHYQDGEYLKTIDYSLSPESSTEFVSDFYLNNVRINSQEKHTEIVTDQGSVQLNKWKLYKKTNGDELFLEEANWTNYTVGADGMIIKNIFTGIDAELIIYPGGIKTNFVIKEAKFGNYESLIFRDELALASGQELSTKLKSNPSITEGVDDLVVSSNGQNLVEFNQAVAYQLGGDKKNFTELKYIVNRNKVDVVVPADWIEKYKGEFDLVIDPQVTGSNTLAQGSITGSLYNASCNFDNSCDQFLTVPAPANATFDDVLWSFDYQAINGAWMSEGAVRFTTGSCESPSQAGYFWFCNTNAGGTCQGLNNSAFSDLGSCLPGPSCNTQNVDFTMEFFRSCYGTTGCNNLYIAAFSPWTMTITGQTIDYTNPSNPITMSATTVCQGEDLTATTTGQDGVPPYTYNWSFDPSGTPSVGTGSSTSINFPNAGTQTLYSIITDDCGNESTSSVNITVHPTPTVSPNPVAESICDGETTGISLSGSPTGVTYSWTANPTNVTGSSAGSGNAINQTLNSATGGDVEYTITPSANGCPGSPVTVVVDVNPNPSPTITGQTTYCAGNTAAISAPSGFSSYNWSTGANTQNTNVTDADNPITVTVIDANGCPGTSPAFTVSEESQINYSETIEICQGQSTTIHGNTETTAGLYEETFTTGGCDSTASITLVVNSLPSITASATDTDVCINDDTDLSGSGGSSYDWDNGLGAGANHNVSPGSTTTYTVTGTDANGCENTDDVTITVNPLPTVDAGTDISECENETIILSGSGSATSYSWDNGVSDGVGFTQPVGTVTYTVTGTDANGCENTDQVDVTIESAPNVYAGTDVTVCENETITLSGSGTATNYTWDNGVTDGVGFTQSPGTVTYTVTGESSAGCAATDEVDVTVNPSPTIDAGSNQELCDGDNVTLTGSGNADTYTWDNGVTDGVDFTPPLGTTTYTVTGENTATGCTATDDVDITVNELPTVDAGADQSICEGEEIILSGSGDATNYTWDNGITDGVGFTPSVGTTVYTVTGEDANGCQNTATVSITTTTNPIADFSADPTEGEAPLEVELTNNSSNGSTFEWDFGNGQFENTNSPTDQNTVYTEPGVFEIWLTVTNDEGCTDQMSLTIVIDDLPLSYTIPNIFTPNKDGSNDFLNMNVNNAESIYMEIFNRWGNLVGIVDSIDPEKGWDGTDHKTGQPASEGVYFYTYKIVDLDGEEVNGHNYVHLKR